MLTRVFEMAYCLQALLQALLPPGRRYNNGNMAGTGDALVILSQKRIITLRICLQVDISRLEN